MATNEQVQAARGNVETARAGAQNQRSIAKLPTKIRSALGKQSAAIAQRKRAGGSSPKTRQELYEIAKRRVCGVVAGWVGPSWPARLATGIRGGPAGAYHPPAVQPAVHP